MINEICFTVFAEPTLDKFYIKIAMDMQALAWYRQLLPEIRFFESLRDERFPVGVGHSDDGRRVFASWIVPVSLVTFLHDKYEKVPYANVKSLRIYQEVNLP
jgi:hypothetical protein